MKFILLFYLCGSGFVSAEKYRGEIFLLLRDPVSTAKGNTGISDPQSLGTVLLNPSLVNLVNPGVYFSHFEVYSGLIAAENLNLKIDIDGALNKNAINIFYLHSDPMEVTRLKDENLGIVEGNIEVDGTQLYRFYLFSWVTGKEISEKSYFGASIKLFRESFYNYAENGAGVDLGYFVRFKNLALGITARDVFFSIFKGKSLEVVHPSFVLGLTKISKNLNWSMEAELFSDGPYPGAIISLGRLSIDFKFGAEYRPMDNFAVRMGFYRGYFNAGAGIKWKKLNLDYSISPNPELNVTHKIGAGICF
ncbi:MAG: hypothetical protein QMD82_03755 [bacterium]|nr:hypothetical protein [bacterium]